MNPKSFDRFSKPMHDRSYDEDAIDRAEALGEWRGDNDRSEPIEDQSEESKTN